MTPKDISSDATTPSVVSLTETAPIAATVSGELQQQAANTAQVFSDIFEKTCQTKLRNLPVSGGSVLSQAETLKTFIHSDLARLRTGLLQIFKDNLQSENDPAVDSDANPSNSRPLTCDFIVGTVANALDIRVVEYTQRVTTALESLGAPDAADRLGEIMAELLRSGDDQVELTPCA